MTRFILDRKPIIAIATMHQGISKNPISPFWRIKFLIIRISCINFCDGRTEFWRLFSIIPSFMKLLNVILSKNLARLKTIVLRLICRICVKIHNKITATVGTTMAFQLTFLAKLLKMKYVYPEPHKNIKLMIEVSTKEAVMLLLTIARISSNLLMCCTVLVYFNLDYCQFY